VRNTDRYQQFNSIFRSLMPRIQSGPGFMIYGYDAGKGTPNILISIDNTPKPFCPNDGARLTYAEKFMRCGVCGFTAPVDDLKPVTTLVAKSDNGAMLVQPSKGSKTKDDISNGASLISDEEVV
jgi:hypothetical protein